VGLGHWGPNLVRALERHPRAKVVVAADASAERRAVIAEKIPGLPLKADLMACLSDYEVDAVVIAAPTAWHFQLGMQALDAGKHVFVEKPLAHNTQAGLELCSKAAAVNKVLMTGHIFLFNQGVIETKKIVDRGDLGRLFYIHSVRTNLGPIRTDVNALWDLASHDISIFNYIFDSLPVEGTCSAYGLLGRPEEDIAQGTLLYPKNRIASFFVSWLDPRKKREITVVGDRKMLTFDDMKPQRPLKVFDKGVTVNQPADYADTFHSFRMSIREGQVIEPEVTTGEPLVNECMHFVDCILDNKKPLTDGQNGLDVVTILEALTRSLNESGRPVRLWDNKERSLGNA
jgi:predicted dehydrogenase